MAASIRSLPSSWRNTTASNAESLRRIPSRTRKLSDQARNDSMGGILPPPFPNPRTIRKSNRIFVGEELLVYDAFTDAAFQQRIVGQLRGEPPNAAKTELEHDRRILRILGQDGRASYQRSRMRSGCRARRSWSASSGWKSPDTSRLSRPARPRQGRPAVTAFVAVRYGASDYVGDEPRMREMEKTPRSARVPSYRGDDCYILKVVAHDLEGVQEILPIYRPNSQMNTRTTIVCPRCSKSLASSTEPD